MDIASLSMALAQTRSISDIGTAVLSKNLEEANTANQGLLKMIDAAAMERSVNPSVGSNFDMLV